MPTRCQDKQRSFTHIDLGNRRIAIVETRDDVRIGRSERQFAVFPKMNLGEIAESAVRKGSKQRVSELDFREHAIAGLRRFFRGNGLSRQIRDARDFLRLAQSRQDHRAVRQRCFQIALRLRPEQAGCNNQCRTTERRRKIDFRIHGVHAHFLPCGFRKGPLQIE